jgi:hypothetical protein
MDPVRALIEKKLSELRLDMNEVSRRVGRNVTWLQQFLKRGKGQSVPEDVRPHLARILGVDEDDLRGENYSIPDTEIKEDIHSSVNDSDSAGQHNGGSTMEGTLTEDERILLENYRVLDDGTRAKQFMQMTILGEKARKAKTSFRRRSSK